MQSNIGSSRSESEIPEPAEKPSVTAAVGFRWSLPAISGKQSSKTITIWKIVFWLALLGGVTPGLTLYLIELSGSVRYWFGLLVFFNLGSLCTLLFCRWDFEWRYPITKLQLAVIAIGCFIGCLPAVLGASWPSIASLLCFLFAFLSVHRERRRKSHAPRRLLLHWFLPAVLAIAPLLETLRADWLGQRLIMSWSERLLQVLGVPYVTVLDAILLPRERIYFDDQLYSWLGWPFFLTAAMLYSVLLRRHWSVTLFNALSAMLWCVVLHCGMVVLKGWMIDQGSEPVGELYTTPLLLLAVAVLFFSSECCFRLLAFPISGVQNAALSNNPLLLTWNAVFSKRPRKRRRKRRRSPMNWMGTLAVTFVVLIAAMVVAQTYHALVAKRLIKTEQAVFAKTGVISRCLRDLGAVDYRHIVQSPLPEFGTFADVWTCYQPSLTARHVIGYYQQRPLDMQAIYNQEGWRKIPASELDLAEVADADGGITDDAAPVTLRRKMAYAYLFSAALAVKQISTPQASHVSPVSRRWVHSLFAFSNKPTAENLALAKQHFAEFLTTAREAF